MTLDQFKYQFKRLCDGHKLQPTPEQIVAFYQNLQRVEACDWEEAVTNLLCRPKFPYLEAVLDMCVACADNRKRREKIQARTQVARNPFPDMGEHDDDCPAKFAVLRLFSGEGNIADLLREEEEKEHTSKGATHDAV